MQKTLKNPVVIKGRGLHTNKDVVMKVSPAPEGYGRRFVRTDLEAYRASRWISHPRWGSPSALQWVKTLQGL